MNTVSQIFQGTGRLSGPEVGDGANQMFQQLTDKTKKKNLYFMKRRCACVSVLNKGLQNFSLIS